MFTKYTPDDYDKHGYLKPPIGFYLLLLMLLRAYVVWILSVANRKDGTALITSLYPNKDDFFAGLVVGIGAVIVTVLLSLRREKASAWMAKVWAKGKWFLWTSWVLDVALTLYVIKQHKYSFEPQYALVLLGLFFGAWYLLKNSRLDDAFANWPKESYQDAVIDDKGTDGIDGASVGDASMDSTATDQSISNDKATKDTGQVIKPKSD